MKPTTDIVEELRLYNRWRRGDEAITAPDPTALGKLLDDAADRIEHLFASGIHTCNADCQRPMCVLRRERDKAQNDLARVTAELEHHKSVKETIDSAHKELSREHAALRARVNELEAQIERDAWTLSPEMVQTRNDQLAAELEQAEQRNAELVAALRPIYALRKNCEGDIGWRGQKDAKVGWVTVRDILALEQALAQAESATALVAVLVMFEVAAPVFCRNFDGVGSDMQLLVVLDGRFHSPVFVADDLLSHA